MLDSPALVAVAVDLEMPADGRGPTTALESSRSLQATRPTRAPMRRRRERDIRRGGSYGGCGVATPVTWRARGGLFGDRRPLADVQPFALRTNCSSPFVTAP
jgi:hypothetical protein